MTRVLVLAALVACGTPARHDSPPALDRVDVTAEVARLGDPQQAVRDAAAEKLRSALARDPHAAGERDAAYWTSQLVAAKGTTSAQFAERFHATSEGGASSGQSTTTIWRLDDYWQVSVFTDPHDVIFGLGDLVHRARSVWVAPPKHFTGRWITYYVNGRVEHDDVMTDDVPVTQTTRYDTGALIMTRHYVSGQLEGVETAYHDNGRVAYEGRYAANKSVGHWQHWFPDGQLETDQTYNTNGELDGLSTTYRPNGTKQVTFEYRDGKEIGQAAWDEHGKLQYAHGSLEGHVP